MKLSKRLPGLIFASLFFLTSINAMAESTDALYVQNYRDVLDRYYTLLTDGSGEGEMGVWEAKLYPLQATALDSVGYALEDISGDCVPELLIGAIARQDNQLAYGSEIFAMYTCVNGEPTLTFEGWARNRYCTMGEGTFFYQGSGGAMFSLFGTYTLTPDGTSLVCDDLYFTYEKSGNPEKVALYHNQTGSMEPAESQELSIPEEQFWQMEAELESRVREIGLLPFSPIHPFFFGK